MISGSARFLINVEALNSVESVGNLTKHRTAPVVVKTSEGYEIRYVPVISGEALAHAYQVALVDIAKKEGLPVGKYSSHYEFIKFTSDDIVRDEGIEPPKSPKENKKEKNEEMITLKIEAEMRRFEVDVLLKDIVADVGGFMYAGNPPVRRTSRIKFGYMIPALKSEIPAQLEPQFHTRSSNRPSKESEQEERRQAIYNVEVSSALYIMSFELDEDLIAEPSTVIEEIEKLDKGTIEELRKKEEQLKNSKKDRVKAAIKALYYILSGNFGGKRSRFLPSMQLMSLVVTYTDFPFIPEPAHKDEYINRTIERMEKAKNIFNGQIAEAYVINNEGISVPSNAKVVSTVEDLIKELLNSVIGGLSKEDSK